MVRQGKGQLAPGLSQGIAGGGRRPVGEAGDDAVFVHRQPRAAPLLVPSAEDSRLGVAQQEHRRRRSVEHLVTVGAHDEGELRLHTGGDDEQAHGNGHGAPAAP
jgi:hypothetical protein